MSSPPEYVPKPITEEVNVTPVHPRANLAYLLAVISAFSVGAYLVLGWISDILVNRIDQETEVEIARRVNPPELEDEASDRDPRAVYSLDLLNAIRDEEIVERVPLRLNVVESEAPNAGVFPGGHIVVTEGLFDAVESENALAFVLAHELGHFENRDPLERLGRGLVFVTITSALGLNSDGGGGRVVSVASELTALHYGRGQELAADEFALAKVVEHYGHGGGSLEFFESILASGNDNRFTDYFSTHPMTQIRIDRLYDLAERNGWSMTGSLTPLPDNVRVAK
ncbi:MAG: M48 family metallopeptidase [Cyanobacteria bacterium P01_E01_bin.45]